MSKSTWTTTIPQPPIETEHRIRVEQYQPGGQWSGVRVPTAEDWPFILELARANCEPVEPVKQEPVRSTPVGWMWESETRGLNPYSKLSTGPEERGGDGCDAADYRVPVYLAPPPASREQAQALESRITSQALHLQNLQGIITARNAEIARLKSGPCPCAALKAAEEAAHKSHSAAVEAQRKVEELTLQLSQVTEAHNELITSTGGDDKPVQAPKEVGK